ncbi:MAG: hypothetical protein HQL44_16790 [Alphaproteobacteria bacterium]|nr:hypothetical protein [Alphaproteobacteria bacterium]
MRYALRCCLWAALVALALHPIRGWCQDQEMRLPYDTHWPLIPENQGMKFFLGKWYPTFMQNYHAINYMILHADGRITYGNNYPAEGFYRIVGTGRNFVLLFVKDHHFETPGEEFTRYKFMFFHAPSFRKNTPDRPPAIASEGFMWVPECGFYFSPKWDKKRDPYDLGEDDWQLPPDKLRERWDNYKPCNPNLPEAKASPDYPLGQNWGSVSKYQSVGHDFEPTYPPWPGK